MRVVNSTAVYREITVLSPHTVPFLYSLEGLPAKSLAKGSVKANDFLGWRCQLLHSIYPIQSLLLQLHCNFACKQLGALG